jgi:hypothetical protein
MRFTPHTPRIHRISVEPSPHMPLRSWVNNVLSELLLEPDREGGAVVSPRVLPRRESDSPWMQSGGPTRVEKRPKTVGR